MIVDVARGAAVTERGPMRRSVSVIVATLLLGVLGVVPALADVDKNPNVLTLVNVICPDAGLSFEAVWSPTAQSVTGHDSESNLVGVAKSVHVTDSEGNPIPGAVLFDRPGKGLDQNTVWCFWEEPDLPTGYAGGDILFRSTATT